MMSWWHQAKPGDRVVCVDDVWPAEQLRAVAPYGVVLPVKGKIYTLRQIGFSNFHQCWLLRLVEIVNPCLVIEGFNPGEATFNVRRFRPLVTRPTDISVFTALLAGEPAKVGA